MVALKSYQDYASGLLSMISYTTMYLQTLFQLFMPLYSVFSMFLGRVCLDEKGALEGTLR